jgi:hypothetical protein
MKLSIISWNIRHLRPDKVADYANYVFPRLVLGRMLFLYENKISNNQNDELCALLAARLDKEAKEVKADFYWLAVPVGTNENVIVCWTRRVKTGDKSSTPNKWITIDVAKNTSFNQELWDKGRIAMESSMNETVMANIQMLRAQFRIPAVVDVTIKKQGGSAKALCIAAWHAPGPATALPPLLWNVFQDILHPTVDLYVGDFNMTGLTPQTKQAIALQPSGYSTTITKTGPTKHREGLDLVARNTVRLGDASSGVNANNGLVGRVNVQVVDPGNDYKKAFAVSDHLPIYIEVKGL